eukprot:6189516-Pleurochrysis_carterae.AAC.6
MLGNGALLMVPGILQHYYWLTTVLSASQYCTTVPRKKTIRYKCTKYSPAPVVVDNMKIITTG